MEGDSIMIQIYLIKEGDLIIVDNRDVANVLIEEGYVEYQKNSPEVLALQNKEYNVRRVYELKNLLINSDYKIIKCYEAQLANEEMPYNLQELLAQRKAWRDEINTLEFELTMLG